MSDEPRDEDDPDDSPPELPEDDKGLGLTEEFRRIEAEIDAELGDAADLDAPDDLPEDDSEPEAGEPKVVRWDDDDSSEWPVAPVPPSRADDELEEKVSEGDETEGTGPDADAGAEGEGEPQAEDEPPVPEPAGETETPESAPEGSPESTESAPGAEGEPEPTPEGEQPEPEPQADEPAIEHTVVRPRPPAPVAIAAGGYGGGAAVPDEEIKDRSPRLWWRFFTASVVIVAATAAAVSVSMLLFFTNVAADFQNIPGLQKRISDVKPGDPQTILILGSDKRANTPGDPGRSDTTMLLRVDAEKKVLSLLSLPRDLRVDIAGRNFGVGKLNEAYTDGGASKTLATVEDLTGLQVDQVVNIDFQGFADAVDAIGCVYIDVDRKYFNDNSGYGEQYATIDVNAGYQRLCGQNALDYVRYRHTDTTFVRDARQQDFLRNARAQVPVSELAPPVFGGGGKSSDLIDIFTKYTSTTIKTSAQIIGLLKSFLVIKDVPVNEVHFPASDEVIGGVAYVTATHEQIHQAVDEFLNGKGTEGPKPGAADKKKPAKKPKEEKPKDGSGADVLSTADSAAVTTGGINKYEAFGRTSARRLNFPIYIPTVVAPGSAYQSDSRQYDIMDPDDDKRPSYKMVISYENPAVNLEYYGVEGTTWDDPPILNDPSESHEIDGRTYDYYYDGDRLRMVAFHDGGNAYWVTNTLLETLDEDQMIAIATSLTEVKEPKKK